MPDIRYFEKAFVRFTFAGLDGNPAHAILAFGDKVDVLQEGSGSAPSRPTSTLRAQNAAGRRASPAHRRPAAEIVIGSTEY